MKPKILDLTQIPLEKRLAAIDATLHETLTKQASEVQHHVVSGFTAHFKSRNGWQATPRYSSDLNAVVKHVEECGWCLETCFFDGDDQDWVVKLYGSETVTARTLAEAWSIALLQERGWRILR